MEMKKNKLCNSLYVLLHRRKHYTRPKLIWYIVSQIYQKEDARIEDSWLFFSYTISAQLKKTL